MSSFIGSERCGGGAEFHRGALPLATSYWCPRRWRSRCRRSVRAAVGRRGRGRRGVLSEQGHRLQPGEGQRNARPAQEMTPRITPAVWLFWFFFIVHLLWLFGWIIAADSGGFNGGGRRGVVAARMIAELAAGHNLQPELRERSVVAGSDHAIDQKLVAEACTVRPRAYPPAWSPWCGGVGLPWPAGSRAGRRCRRFQFYR